MLLRAVKDLVGELDFSYHPTRRDRRAAEASVETLLDGPTVSGGNGAAEKAKVKRR